MTREMWNCKGGMMAFSLGDEEDGIFLTLEDGQLL